MCAAFQKVQMTDLVRRVLERVHKPLPDDIIKILAELTEGFAPEGVSKDSWKSILYMWERRHNDDRYRLECPAELRHWIEENNDIFGVRQWRTLESTFNKSLRGQLSISRGLEGKSVFLEVPTYCVPIYVKILKVNDDAILYKQYRYRVDSTTRQSKCDMSLIDREDWCSRKKDDPRMADPWVRAYMQTMYKEYVTDFDSDEEREMQYQEYYGFLDWCLEAYDDIDEMDPNDWSDFLATYGETKL